MCGFAGVVAWADRYRVDRDTLRRMSARIAHRGPDGEGLYLNHEDEVRPDRPQVGLVHRRLAIIDPDPRADQPFTDGRGRWLVFNGEIYNFRELRAELKGLKPDYEWRTNCDTEVLLVAYDAWGERCVEHLNGMFAFAVWDGAKGELFLARDRMGQKPLYVAYRAADGNATKPRSDFDGERPATPPAAAIVFGSELEAVRASGPFDSSIDICALTAYLQLGYLPLNDTMFPAVRRLRPAERVTARQGACREERYWPDTTWPIERTAKPLHDAAAVSRTRSLVTQAVRRQLVADVPLGCLLSGGIDSSVVAAAMTAASSPGQRVLTFSIGFDDPRYDESMYAGCVAKHLGTQHHSFTVRPDAAAELPELARAFGEPFADSSALPTHYLSREVRRHVKVALSGDGGDELFGGYDRYRAMLLARRVRGVTTRAPWLLMAPLLRRLPGTHPKSALTRVKRFTTSVGMSPERRYSTYMRLFDGDTIVELMGHLASTATPWGPTHNDLIYSLFGVPHFNFNAWSGAPRDHLSDDVRAALAVDRILYLPDDLLTKVDRASMLHALEVRSPFMDHELVQFAAGLTTDQLLKGGPKRMLREAFAADLPAWVFKRKKMGFAVPIGDWFRGELRPMLHDHLFAADSFAARHLRTATVRRLVEEHETGRQDHAQRLYALLMLELWWKTQRA